MRNILFASLALAVIGTACDDKPTESATDSSDVCTDCPTAINAVTFNHDEVSWWYDVDCSGWTGLAELYIFQTGSSNPWFEYGHEFWETESFDNAPDDDTRGYYDPAGYWDNPYLELTMVSTIPEVVLGSTTLFGADDAEFQSTMTWSVVVYDTSMAQADCGSWGDDPSFVHNDANGNYDFSACPSI